MSGPLEIGLLTPGCRGYNATDGGIASHFADLAVALADAGHHVRVITPEPAAGFPRADELTPVQFVPFAATMPRWLDRLTGLRWQLHSVAGLRHRIAAARRATIVAATQQRFDLIETTSSGVLAAGLTGGAARCPLVTRVSTTAAQLVAHNHGTSRWPERVEQRHEEASVRASDGLITHTLHHRDEICRIWSLAPERFAIVPHGIAVPHDKELAPPSARADIEVLFVGRFEHRKGIDTLLDAIPRLLAEIPDLRFTLIGQDPNRYWQKTFSAASPALLLDRVRFAGCVTDGHLRTAYRDCDFFVAPSRYESFGLIYVEAMAWGKPAIGCRVGGVPEVIADGETGYLVPAGDSAALAARIRELALSPTLRARLGAAGRRRVQRLFSRTTLAANSAACYRAILNGPQPTQP